MSVKVHANGNCRMKRDSYPPTAEEIEVGYSDGGYPTLPRPKVILSIPRPDSPWSAREASKLQTVPVRLQNGHRPRARTVSPPAPKTDLKGRSVNSVAAATCSRTCREQVANQPCDVVERGVTFNNCRVNRTAVSDNPTAPPARSNSWGGSRSAFRRLDGQRANCPASSINSSAVATTTTHYGCCIDGSPNNRGRSRSEIPARTIEATMSQGKGGKKSKKPSRALSFSFGDRKKRALSSVLGTFRRLSNDDTAVGVPRANGSPVSPILLGRRRAQKGFVTPSPILHSSNLREQCIMEEHERGSISSMEDWANESGGPRTPNGNESRDARTQTWRVRAGCGRENSSVAEEGRNSHSRHQHSSSGSIPTALDTHMQQNGHPLPSPGLVSVGEVSSLRESVESLPLSVRSNSLDTPPTSTPSSRRQSPFLRKSNSKGQELPPLSSAVNGDRTAAVVAHTAAVTPPRVRKLSDPVVSTPEGSPTHERKGDGRGVKLRKGHSFCVSQSRTTRQVPDWKEMRRHVVRFLLETEQSYVQSLRTIIRVYLEPLKRPQAASLADPTLVKEIFHQIPEICTLHERFLAQINRRVESWHPQQKIGDIFNTTFSKCQLMDIYTKFIHNFLRAKAAIELAKQSRPVFAKFLEQRAKESRGRLSLDDLLIKPVQRIPRYVLFIRDLLKHTDPSHPDHSPLQQALGELTTLAERVNESERELSRIDRQRDLLAAVDGLALLLNSQSTLVRYDMVTEIKGNIPKKDRFLILYSDVVVCASARRRSTGFKRSSLLNLNTLLPEALRYKIKWHAPLTELSIAQVQAPLFERRRLNTLEKMLENMRKDEETIQQMLGFSEALHRPHQPLMALLREMQVEVKETIADKKEELENLPHEMARIDLISYAIQPPSQYALVFPSQRIRNSWEKDFLLTKEAADNHAPSTALVAPPTSPPPIQYNVSPDLQFLHPLLLHSGRIGTQLTCTAVGLPVDCDSSTCLWVCCSDGYGGQVCLLDLEQSTQPQLVANITISDSKILCITAVPTQGRKEFSLLNGAEDDRSVGMSKGAETASISSSDSSSDSSRASVGRTHSSSPSGDLQQPGQNGSIHILGKEEEEEEAEGRKGGEPLERKEQREKNPDPNDSCKPLLGSEGDKTAAVVSEKSGRLEPSVVAGGGGKTCNGVLKDETVDGNLYPSSVRQSRSLARVAFRRVRSNSVPPDVERGLEETDGLLRQKRSHHRHHHHHGRGRSTRTHSPSPTLPREARPNKDHASAATKLWSPLTLRPSNCLDGEGRNFEGLGGRCMWLGTEGGQVHIYGAGDNLRARSQRKTVELPAPVHCIRCFDGRVYVGLGNGSIAVLDPEDAASHGPRHWIALGEDPVLCCVPVRGELWAACGQTLYRINDEESTGKALATLPSEQWIHSMVATGNSVWVNAGDTPILHVYHAPSASLLATVDCTRTVVEVLRGYDAIIRQHKSANLRITTLLLCDECLLIGTSAGTILGLSLPSVGPEPHPLLHPPCPTPLPRGHVDPVHFLSSMQRDGTTLVFSGGNGLEDFTTATTSEEISETASCLLLWKAPI